MKAPLNRRVHVVGYEAASALGSTFAATWDRAAAGETRAKANALRARKNAATARRAE